MLPDRQEITMIEVDAITAEEITEVVIIADAITVVMTEDLEKTRKRIN
jgi:hypothetical protein